MSNEEQDAAFPPKSIRIIRTTRNPKLPQDPRLIPPPVEPKKPWSPRRKNDGIPGQQWTMINLLIEAEEEKVLSSREKQRLKLARQIMQGKVRVTGGQNSELVAIQRFVKLQTRRVRTGSIRPESAAALIVKYASKPRIGKHSPNSYVGLKGSRKKISAKTVIIDYGDLDKK